MLWLSPVTSTLARLGQRLLACAAPLLRIHLPDFGRTCHEHSRLRCSRVAKSDPYALRSGHVVGGRYRRPIRARCLPGPQPRQWLGVRVLPPGVRLPDRHAVRHPQFRRSEHGTAVRCGVADGAGDVADADLLRGARTPRRCGRPALRRLCSSPAAAPSVTPPAPTCPALPASAFGRYLRSSDSASC